MTEHISSQQEIPAAESTPAVATTSPEQIKLERMGTDACAVGHLQSGKTIFVPHGAPGDVVTVEITEDKPSFSRGRILSVDQKSSVRVKPTCAFAEVCGGCSWQHLTYEAQCEAKRANVVSALARLGKFSQEAAQATVSPLVPSKRTWGYRNKLELQVQTPASGKLEVGFCEEGSHDLAKVERCPLAHPQIEGAPKALRGALRYLQGNSDLGIFRVGVRASVRTKELEIALWTKPTAFPRTLAANVLGNAFGHATSIVRVLADPGHARAVKKVEVLAGKGNWEESLYGCTFLTSAPSFFQVNTAQAEKLIEHVICGLGGVENKNVADLYAGGGTFSLPLAKAGANVVAIEAAGSSVRDLRRNAQTNNVCVEVVGGTTERQFKGITRALDALVVDPPRAGLDARVVKDIAKAHPKRVAYVSCNPTTWARDVVRFKECGYELLSVVPVDMFPQTYHVEVVSILERK